jgi:hypothetical protein
MAALLALPLVVVVRLLLRLLSQIWTLLLSVVLMQTPGKPEQAELHSERRVVFQLWLVFFLALALVAVVLLGQQAGAKTALAGFILLFLAALTVVELDRMDIYLTGQ